MARRLPTGKLRRGRPILDTKKRILVVGDGATEGNYFDGLRIDLVVRERIVLVVKSSKGGSAQETVQKAIDHVRQAKLSGMAKHDEVWCVLDVEWADHAEALKDALKAAKKHRFFVALSNPCFEVWFVAHFGRTARQFSSNAQVLKVLDKHWNERFQRIYKKNSQDTYNRLKPLTDAAIKNACEVREHDHDSEDTSQCNSSTDVYKLVQKLVGEK